jgi:hypothetical protein
MRAVTNCPVLDRKMAMAMGDRSQRKTMALAGDGFPAITR